MLRIRLSRIGKKNKPMYRLTVSEGARDLYGRALEILGSYNPHSKDLEVKADRIKYWISVGAQPSATVNNLLIDKKIITGEKKVASKPGEGLKKIEEAKKAEAAAKAAPSTETAKPETAPETPAVTDAKTETAPEAKEEVKTV